MNKLIISAGLLLGIGTLAYAAQPRSAGSINVSKISIDTKTIAQINALTPDTTGQIVACSDCTQSTICISSSTNRGGFVVIAGSSTFVGATWSALPHCQ